MTATADAICSRVETLIAAQTPLTLAENRFIAYRNEGGADFFDWAQKNAAGAFRRYQVRVQGYDGSPAVNNMVIVERRLILQIAVAYPQNARTGKNNAADRDKAMDQDWRTINWACGITGAGNFSGANDCTPLGLDEPTWERQGNVDFVVMRGVYLFECSAAPA